MLGGAERQVNVTNERVGKTDTGPKRDYGKEISLVAKHLRTVLPMFLDEHHQNPAKCARRNCLTPGFHSNPKSEPFFQTKVCITPVADRRRINRFSQLYGATRCLSWLVTRSAAQPAEPLSLPAVRVSSKRTTQLQPAVE